MMHAKRHAAAPTRHRAAIRRGVLLTASVLATQALLAAPALAQTSGAPSSEVEEVVVTAGYRFLSEDTSGATNLPLPIEQVPQSITLVNQDFLKAADIKNLGEVAQYSPGVFFSGSIGNSVSLIQIRGFTTTYAFDGLTTGNILSEPDAAVVDRLEIVKGPSSVVYGAASPGGVTNLVLKSATADTPTYLSVLGGSWNRWRLEGQVAGALNASGSVRGIVVGAAEESDSYMDVFHLQRSVLYGGIDADVTDTLTTYVRAERERVARPGYGGFGLMADGTPPPLPRSFTFVPSDSQVVSDTDRLSVGATWQATPMLSFELKGNYSMTKHVGPAPLWNGLAQANGNFNVLTRYLYFRIEDFNVGASGVYKLDDLGLEDSFVSASALYSSNGRVQFTRFPTINGTSTPVANYNTGAEGLANFLDRSVYPGISPSLNEQQLYYTTYSTQAVIKLVGPLKVLAGVSYSDPIVKNRTVVGRPWTHYNPKDQVSYRAGLMYEPIEGVNGYLSYSESFQPNFRIDRNDAVLPPVQGTQYEAGVKYISPDRRLLLTGSVYQLEQANTAVVTTFIGADGFARYEAIGKVRHRGFELEAVGQITDKWQVQGGYSYLDAKITRDIVAANVGHRRPWLPKSSGSVYSTYTFDNGLFASGGARFVSSVPTTTLGTTKNIPSYILVDAAVGYSFDDWRLQVNVKNLFDEKYYLASGQTLTGGVVYGEPRSFTVTVRRDF